MQRLGASLRLREVGNDLRREMLDTRAGSKLPGPVSASGVQAIKSEATKLLDQWAFLHSGDVSYELIKTVSQASEQFEHGAKEMERIAMDELSL
ncbi:hypothetical protein LTR49_024250 [Elasticomyces elasticus]|nr:hypothetical protein LTR49_024250 [Elasticomyces elasticus]